MLFCPPMSHTFSLKPGKGGGRLALTRTSEYHPSSIYQIPAPPTQSHPHARTISDQRLDVEALCRHDVCNIFVRQLFQDGGLSTVVQTQHQQARLLVRL